MGDGEEADSFLEKVAGVHPKDPWRAGRGCGGKCLASIKRDDPSLGLWDSAATHSRSR